jgi:hypothetical protein
MEVLPESVDIDHSSELSKVYVYIYVHSVEVLIATSSVIVTLNIMVHWVVLLFHI